MSEHKITAEEASKMRCLKPTHIPTNQPVNGGVSKSLPDGRINWDVPVIMCFKPATHVLVTDLLPVHLMTAWCADCVANDKTTGWLNWTLISTFTTDAK